MASAAVKKPMNSSNQVGVSSAKGKINNASNLKKKIETFSKQQPVDTKNKSIPQKSVKPEDKGKAVAPKTPVKRAKREKKVYSLAGQKYDPPEEREPLRIFYESLSKQIPSSEMAEFWLMEHGMLPPERAKKAYEKKQRKQKQLRTGTPIRPPPPSSKPESSSRQKVATKSSDSKVKRKIVDDSDDEVIAAPKRRKA